MGETFVLVHGGGHGGWCWQRTARELRARDHDVYAPTLTGFGERCHLSGCDITFATFVDDIVNVLLFEDLGDVVLVGHSMGGVVIPRVAEAVPDRMKRLVWLAAVVTADGESLLEAVPQSPWIARAVTIAPDGTAITDPELILDANIHDGSPEEKDLARRLHRPYPRHALIEPGRLSAFLALGVPTAYLAADEDRTIEGHVSARFAARLPGALVGSVPGGHDCMITRPVELADALENVAAAGRSS